MPKNVKKAEKGSVFLNDKEILDTRRNYPGTRVVKKVTDYPGTRYSTLETLVTYIDFTINVTF